MKVLGASSTGWRRDVRVPHDGCQQAVVTKDNLPAGGATIFCRVIDVKRHFEIN
jgi:hypothetical protein